MPRADSVKAAIGLLKHPNWQVRAEAVDALSGLSADEHLGPALRSDASAALADLMDDPEPFVISRVFHGLIDNRIDIEADRLEKAADKHPELTADVISLLLGRWHSTSPKDVVVLRAFFKKPDSSVRAAILAGLNGGQAEAFSAEIVASLSDKSPAVREAAANLLFKAAGNILEAARSNRTVDQKAGEVPEPREESNIVSDLLSAIGSPKVSKNDPSAPSAAARSIAAMAEAIPPGRRRKRPGLRDTAAPLVKMLDGAPGERLAAATALVALGEHDDRTLPMLKQIARGDPASREKIAMILPWLAWDKRNEWFNLLTSLDTGRDGLREIVTQMVVWPDARAEELLWKQLAAFNDCAGHRSGRIATF